MHTQPFRHPDVSHSTPCIGIDLGGTKLEGIYLEIPHYRAADACVPDPNTWVRHRIRIPTEAHLGYAHVLSRLVDLVQHLKQTAPEPVRASLFIGVGLPGHLSRKTQCVKNSNTVCLNGQDLWSNLQQRLGRPIGFDNDANCLTLAEARLGAGRGFSTVFGLILGTGVGGGLYCNGQLWSGLQGIAGEWGHTCLQPAGIACYCGKSGCVETYLSGPALERELRSAGLCLSAEHFNRLLASGEEIPPGAMKVWENYLDRFGHALSTVVNIVDPEAVIIGGGLSQLAPIYSAGRDAVRRYVFNDELLTKILPASLGDSGGVFGAALIGQDPAGQVLADHVGSY